MHSRIYQVSSSPVKEEDKIREYRYEDDHLNGVADYIVEQTSETDIKSDISWLSSVNKGIKVDVESRTITITSKKEYFESKHEKFQELAGKLSGITLEEFIDGKSYFDFYELKSMYEDKHGFYIDDNDEYIGLTSMDNWVRNAEENKEYHIGSVFDYHF